MIGHTYAALGIERALSDRIGDRALADYIRWEFRPGDRASAILAVKGEIADRRRRPRLVRRLHARREAARRTIRTHPPIRIRSEDDRSASLLAVLE